MLGFSMRAHKRAWPAVAGGAIALWATVGIAAAAPLDFASDRVALSAYHTYVGALVADTGTGRSATRGFILGVRRSCGGTLSSLASHGRKNLSESALLAFGQEIGGDVAIEFDAEALTPFTTLSSRLGPLRWSRPATSRAMSAFLTAERASLQIAPSNICADARALSARPSAEPAGTGRFLTSYLPAAALAKSRLKPFLAVLSHFQTPSEAGVIGSIGTLAAQFAASSKTTVAAGDSALVAALGLR